MLRQAGSFLIKADPGCVRQQQQRQHQQRQVACCSSTAAAGASSAVCQMGQVMQQERQQTLYTVFPVLTSSLKLTSLLM